MLENTFYTIPDAKKPPSAYVSSIASLASQCGEGDRDFPLVLRAWRNLDLPLRRTIDEPEEGTAIPQIIAVLNIALHG